MFTKQILQVLLHLIWPPPPHLQLKHPSYVHLAQKMTFKFSCLLDHLITIDVHCCYWSADAGYWSISIPLGLLMLNIHTLHFPGQLLTESGPISWMEHFLSKSRMHVCITPPWFFVLLSFVVSFHVHFCFTSIMHPTSRGIIKHNIQWHSQPHECLAVIKHLVT